MTYVREHLPLVSTVSLVLLGVLRVLAVAHGDPVTAGALTTPETAVKIALQVLTIVGPTVAVIALSFAAVMARPPLRPLKATIAVLVGAAICLLAAHWVLALALVVTLALMALAHATVAGTRARAWLAKSGRKLFGDEMPASQIDRLETLVERARRLEDAHQDGTADENEIRKVVEEFDESRRTFYRTLAAIALPFLLILVLPEILSPRPWVPRELIELDDRQSVIDGYVISDGEWWTVLRREDHSVVRIRGDDVAARTICGSGVNLVSPWVLLTSQEAPGYEDCGT